MGVYLEHNPQEVKNASYYRRELQRSIREYEVLNHENAALKAELEELKYKVLQATSRFECLKFELKKLVATPAELEILLSRGSSC